MPRAFKLLVVEDDPAISRMLSAVLALEGHEVTVVADGTEVIQSLLAASYDAVVLDVMLPGLDGVSIMHQIRQGERTRSIPVVMLTAKADGASTWGGWQAGCDWYMTKPFDPAELIAILNRVAAPVA